MSMRPAEPDVEFATFCQVVQQWLCAAPSLDPCLAAATDVLGSVSDLDQLDADLLTVSDTHAALGASTVLALWEAFRTLR
jgi:hypothetical protein